MELMKEVSLKMLNAIEMSSQEAAWYLLQLGMSQSSRKVEIIPTVWPHERQKTRKTKAQMDKEELAGDSMDVWNPPSSRNIKSDRDIWNQSR